MKNKYLLCLGAVLSIASAVAQLPATTPASPGPVMHSLMLDVETIHSGGSSSATATTATLDHVTTLEATIRNFGPAPDQAQLEWYFFGKKIADPRSIPFVYNSGNKAVQIPQGDTQKVDISSQGAQTKVVSKAETMNFTNAAGQRYQQNVTVATLSPDSTKAWGWVLIMSAGGKIIDVRASESKFEDMARDPDKLAALRAGKPVSP